MSYFLDPICHSQKDGRNIQNKHKIEDKNRKILKIFLESFGSCKQNLPDQILNVYSSNTNVLSSMLILLSLFSVARTQDSFAFKYSFEFRRLLFISPNASFGSQRGPDWYSDSKNIMLLLSIKFDQLILTCR